MRRNPGFDGTVLPEIDAGVVTGFKFITDRVADITTVRALTQLHQLDIQGTGEGVGVLVDLSPLKGMPLKRLELGQNKVSDLTPLKGMPLESLNLWQWRGTDLTPLKDMPLKWLNCGGALQKLDLTPLSGMPLNFLCVNFTQVSDLRALRDVPVKILACSNTPVSDLSPLKDKPLTELYCCRTKVSDLSPLAGMPLKSLHIYDTSITDLSPLQGMALEDICLTPKNITRGLDILRDMKSLKTIGIGFNQAWPAAEFWERYGKGEFGKAVAPFTDADVQRIAALPAEQQVEAVRKELKRRNPGFDGMMEHKIEGGVVTELRIVSDQVTDIAPIRVFDALRALECRGTYTDPPKGLLADLTPLNGINLAGLTHLDVSYTKVSDAGLAHFKDFKNLSDLSLSHTGISDAGMAHLSECKSLASLDLGATGVSDAGLIFLKDCKALTRLIIADTKVRDAGLIHLKDCKNLLRLYLNNTKVTDAGLANFKGMPLMVLWIQDTAITDLTPLQGMPLEEIRLTPKNITRGLDILRDMKRLKTIGIAWNQAWPAAEFWERYDKGEFK
jgi:Leucine-rich repeat (LRR) protein